VCVAVAVSEQGSRYEMEDFYFLDSNFGGTGNVFGGVYDGHNGSHAARYAAEHLHLYFLACLRAGNSPNKAFPMAYRKVSDDLKHQDSGTTAATFLIDEARIHIANVGDSRILVGGPDEMLQLTVDHRLNDSEEFKRVILSGGRIKYPYVMKGFQGLMPTRALGDEFFRDVGVIPTPWVAVHDIGRQDTWLLAATDGLFDVVDNRETARLCRGHTEPARLAQALVRHVRDRSSSSDNTTIILVKLS
jgi:serine/threonine protein phosphatase PrpC